MINKDDTKGLLIVSLWLLTALLAALDGLTLFVVIYLGTGVIFYAETVKQWSYYGLSWEFVILFIGTVIMLCTATVYAFSVAGFIERVDIGPEYLSKLNSSYAGLFIYIAFQARLARREHRQICEASRKINGHSRISETDKS